jgi:hypothetical protein
MTERPTLHVLTSTYKPVGGVVKIMDYVTHAMASGFDVSVWCRRPWKPSLPLFDIERFRNLTPELPGLEFHSRDRLVFRRRDLAFVSLPPNYERAYRSLPRGMSPERIIHIVQNVRHVNPEWGDGYPVRLLTRPAARISINDIVGDVIRPWLDPRGLHEVIPLGHELGYFARERTAPLGEPVKVAYTTWKSDVGDRVRDLLADDRRFTFRAIGDMVSWAELRELYSWADVFLCTPYPEEGLYLPGIEAMANGCLVVSPDVGGNMAYCRPGENCLLVPYDDPSSYADALRTVAAWSPAEVDAFRAAGYAATAPFDLAHERTLFADYLTRLWKRIEAFESPGS